MNLSYLIDMATESIFFNTYSLTCEANIEYIKWINHRFNYYLSTEINKRFKVDKCELFLYMIHNYPLQELSIAMFNERNHYPILTFIKKCLFDTEQDHAYFTNVEKENIYKSGLYLFLSRDISAYTIDAYFNSELEHLDYFKKHLDELYSLQFYAEIKEFYKSVWKQRQYTSTYTICKFEEYLFELDSLNINWHPLTIIAINKLVLSFLRKRNIPERFINIYKSLKNYSTLEFNDKLVKQESRLFIRSL